MYAGNGIGLLRMFALVVLFLHVTSAPSTVPQENWRNVNNVSTPPDESGPICASFLTILIDHMLHRLKLQLPDPYATQPVSNTLFSLKQGQLYGLHKLQRTCPLVLKHEEVWRTRQSLNSTEDPNMEVTIPEWMRKRDEKIADVLRVDFCLGIPTALQLRGEMQVFMFGTYDPERVCITLSDISIRIQLSLQLNRNGSMKLSMVEMRLERMAEIQLASDVVEKKMVDRLNHPRKKVANSASSFIESYGSLTSWLVNGPLYAPLVIILESLMKESFTALLEKQQNQWSSDSDV